MHSMLSLFKETRHETESVPKKHRKRLNRKCKKIKDIENNLPKLSYPDVSFLPKSTFLEDLETVISYFLNPNMSNNFLFSSDHSVEDCFKLFCKEMDVYPDWKEISEVLKDVDTVILRLKYKHDRPRPKTYLRHQSDTFESIKDCKSPSFPSGHTTVAYFISEVLSEVYPELRPDFENIATLIGQTRIENGVHFPTDVSAGKLLGQILASSYLEGDDISKYRSEGIKKKDSKNFARYLVQKSNDVADSVSDFANYIYMTNKIENYNIPFDECIEASRKVHQGYPVNYVSRNPHVISTVKPIIYSFKRRKLSSPSEIISLHSNMSPDVLERGAPGELRDYMHYSPSGHPYVSGEDVYKSLMRFCQTHTADPFKRHAYFEHIHPFCDGNGRIGRVILCNDLEYNFAKINSLIGHDYIDRLNSYFSTFNA